MSELNVMEDYNIRKLSRREKRFRMGKRMKEIVKVLEKAERPLTLSEIIIRILGKKTPSYGVKVAGALIDSNISYEGMSLIRVKGKKRDYHPVDYANVLYALYSRSMKILYKHRIVIPLDPFKTNRKRWMLNPLNLNVKKKFLNVKEESNE